MIAQPSLFDAREDGVAEVLRHVGPEDVRRIVDAVLALPAPFKVEDARQVLPVGVVERAEAFPNVWGAVATRLARSGLIRPVGFAPSSRPERRGGLVRTWTTNTTEDDG